MVTPVINNIAPFDAEIGTRFTFTYTGGITDSYFEIFDTNNSLIYDSRNDSRVGVSQLKQRTIHSATETYIEDGVIKENLLKNLVNNSQYYIQLTVINGEESSTSEKKLFRCITTPTLSVYVNDGTEAPLSDSYILTTASLEIYASYVQSFVDGEIYEDLNCYQFILYDNNYQAIYTSQLYYNLYDDENNHIYTRINGLEEKRYFLKVIGKTIHGYLIENVLITIDVVYKSSTQKTTLYVENCYDEGFIKVGTNIHALLYRLGYEPAKFVDDVIDLRDNWLEYYDGLTVNGDYLAYFRLKNPVYNTNLIRITGESHNVYMNCYKHDTYMSMVEIEETYGDNPPDEEVIKKSELYFDLRIYTNDKVEMLVSDVFSVEKMNDKYFNVYICRKGSTYSFFVTEDWYNLTYVLNGGENDNNNPITYNENDVITLYEALKVGNTFKGWYYDSSFTQLVPSTFVTPDKDLTVYAKWQPNTYAVTYIDGGDANTNPLYYTYGTTVVLQKTTRTGYDFVGWYLDSELSQQITNITDIMYGDIILYGKWDIKVYTITYVLNGGENSERNPKTYTINAEINLYTPTRNGYTFGGWYYNTTFNEQIITPFTAPANDLTVYAKWTANTYDITYVDGGDTNTNPTTYTYGVGFTLSTPTKAGYNFIGWYVDSEFEEEITSISNTILGDLIVYAKWKPIQYTITYKTSYKDEVSNITIISDNGGNPTQYCIEDNITLLAGNINNDSYEFEGWYIGSSTSCDYSTKITIIDGSTETGILYLYPKILAKEWFTYTYDDSTMTATLRFTNKAVEMNEFYIPAKYNGYEVSNIVFPSLGYDSVTNKLNTSSTFTVDTNNKYYFSDDDGNMFYYNGSSTLNMVWYNDINSYCKESVFTNAMLKTSEDSLTIASSAFLGHDGLEKIAICDNVYTISPTFMGNGGNYAAQTFKGCSNLTDIYFTCDISTTISTHCASRASYRREKLSDGTYNKSGVSLDSYVKSGGTLLNHWQPTTSCTVYIKDSSISVGIDSKQTISETYDWELPDELK